MMMQSISNIIRMLGADFIENKESERILMGVCIDSRKVVRGNLYIPIHGVVHNGHAFVHQAIENGAAAVLWERDEPNPPHDVPIIYVENTTHALQKLASVYRQQLHMKVIGITGSNGKTSTKDIVAALCSQRYRTQKTLGNYNNEIGVPLTLLSFSQDVEVGVVEMGMENPGELSFLTNMVRPDIAIISNVGIAHLENLGTLENIARAKVEIIEGLPANGILIYNGDQSLLRTALQQARMDKPIQTLRFGKTRGSDAYVHHVRQMEDGLFFTINQSTYHMNMIGKHQAMNAAAAWLSVKALPLDEFEIQAGFNSVEKSGLRNELINVGCCRILNDSYKSNPQSAKAALETMEEFACPYKVAVLGDMLELGETSETIHYQLGEDLAQFHLDEILTIGDMATYIAQGARHVMGENVIIEHFQDDETLLAYLRGYMHQECMILIKGSRGLQLDVLVDRLVKEDKEI